jgi:MoxR-like ATPase
MPSQSIALSRTFRPFVLAELRALAGWPAYREANNLASHKLSSSETRAACAALGYDLVAAQARFLQIELGRETSELRNALQDAAACDLVIGAETPMAAKADDEPLLFSGRDPADVVSEVLAPISVHMTPHLQAIMPGLLAPLVQAAIAGPRVVTVVQHAPAPGASVPQDVQVVSRVPAWQAFGLKRAASAPSAWRTVLESMIGVCDAVDAPRIDPDFMWPPSVLAHLVACDTQGMNLWAFGPAGTGKTESVEQYAARLHRPFFRVAITRNTEAVDLIGQLLPAQGGGTQWNDGLLTRALRTPHAVILIDEPSLLRPGALAVFQTVLDTRRLRLVTGEPLDVARGVFVVAADNTAGAGDDTGRYLETAPLNAAFMDRFPLKLQYEYLSEAHEATIVARRANVPVEAARLIVAYAGLTRAKAASSELTMGLTPRQLVGWAKAVKAGLPSSKVFDAAVINGAVAEDRELLRMLASTSLTSDHARIEAIISGNVLPAPAAPSEGPGEAPSKAGKGFPDDQVL